jgi:peptidoglycan/xylan/chitin deacetylase (PgdA/CDA1 family)
MIGVLAKEEDRPAVEEFFQLFKTPWEFCRCDRSYDVVICTEGRMPKVPVRLVLAFGGERNALDRDLGILSAPRQTDRIINHRGSPIPIYGKCLGFEQTKTHAYLDKLNGSMVVSESKTDGSKLIRIGYDLFYEVRFLLTKGQPSSQASFPTLDLHISLLRDCLRENMVEFVEIPPIPAGYSFIVSLTHDVDHFGIKNHLWDHTVLGFLYRATIGSFVDVLRGRKSFKQLISNWLAALSLPFVHLGLVKDFWCQLHRYPAIEDGGVSTFFIIPKSGEPGINGDGKSSPMRAARYTLEQIKGDLKGLVALGCEIGVHGIDAWRDKAKGGEELERISRITGNAELGVRMHWLYFGENSHNILESAGFSYDSTVGYNETVGYRAGTVQAYKPFEATRLLELPMHLMDTALFYPSHLNLSPKDAKRVVEPLIRNAQQFGGVLTINWHDRSIAPERLWEDAYLKIMRELKSRGGWFSTAEQAVSWFRMRRSATFEPIEGGGRRFRVRAALATKTNLPGLSIRSYPAAVKQPLRSHASKTCDDDYTDLEFANEVEIGRLS